MLVRQAHVSVTNLAARKLIDRWYSGCFCRPRVNEILANAFPPPGAQQRLLVCVDNQTVSFRLLPLTQGDIVLLGREEESRLLVVFYDRATGQFLPASAKLLYTERLELASKRNCAGRVHEMIDAALQCSTPTKA